MKLSYTRRKVFCAVVCFIPGVVVGGCKVVGVKERESHVSYILLAYF